MAATVGTALGFEHIGDYIPCKLCLDQRVPYYVGVPVMALAALSATLRWPPLLTRGLLLAGGLLMVWGLYLGVSHAGVEWGLWAGPTDCGAVAAPADTGGNGVLDCHRQFRPALLRQGGAAHPRPVLRRLERGREPVPGDRRLPRRVCQGLSLRGDRRGFMPKRLPSKMRDRMSRLRPPKRFRRFLLL